ncbi:MAG: peptidylprolyl isomerase [Legionellaceae bacterium]|nr:peptidylprolyl isomerase [Legionellaceae bacterium]
MFIIRTSHGDIHIQLDDENTPKSAENFKQYVADGFYNNTLFHRVIDNFVIQGGGLETGLVNKATRAPIENEAKRAKLNKRGTLAMARTMDPHSATSQFFINLSNNDFLNFSSEDAQGYGYCVFGEVVAGMDVVDKIAKVRTGNMGGHADVPLDEVMILEVVEQETQDG